MRYLCALFVSVSLVACASGGVTLDQSIADSLTHIQIVAIEGPPLSGAGVSRVGLSGSELLVGGTTLGSSSLLIVGGVMMLADLPRANAQNAAASANIESLLDQNETWEPTLVVAEQAMSQLTMNHQVSASVKPGLQRLPGVEARKATLFMENWMAPLRSWYNDSPSAFLYPDQPGSAAVLEVGLLNYELTTGYLLVQVVTKLVDPSSGAVLAKARNFSNTRVDNVDRLFEKDAAGYKQLFQGIAVELIEDCIADLGI